MIPDLPGRCEWRGTRKHLNTGMLDKCIWKCGTWGFTSVPRMKKNQKPDDRLRTKFTAGNSRSAQSPAVNLTPAARFLVFLTYAPKSVKPHVPHFQKAHPTGGILPFSPLKRPFSFGLWGFAKGIFRLRKKTDVRRVFGCAFQKRGTGNSDDFGMSLENRNLRISVRIYRGLCLSACELARCKSCF